MYPCALQVYLYNVQFFFMEEIEIMLLKGLMQYIFDNFMDTILIIITVFSTHDTTNTYFTEQYGTIIYL